MTVSPVRTRTRPAVLVLSADKIMSSKKWGLNVNDSGVFCLIFAVGQQVVQCSQWRHINNAPAVVLPTLVMGCVVLDGEW